MTDPEIICLSSDEDEVIYSPVIKNETTFKVPNDLKTEKKLDISDSNKSESKSSKKANSSLEKCQNSELKECKATLNPTSVHINNSTSTLEDKIQDNIKKKRKVSAIEDSNVVTKRSRSSDTCIEEKLEDNNVQVLPDLNTSLLQTKKDANIAIVKPQLIMKEKKNVVTISQDIFPMFISLCLQRDRSPDMEKIVNKLKRNYEQMDVDYASSEDFTKFLNEKRKAITNGKGMYKHISELIFYMKSKRKGKIHLKQGHIDAKKRQQCQESLATCATTNEVQNVDTHTDNELEEEDNSDETERINRKVRKIVKVMHKCEKVIKKLEEEEVDFNEDNDSSYIKLERYKERMVLLYNMYCKLTGENADAGRPYLRPKHFSSTQIVVVDQAISKFVNSEIMKKNNLKSTGTLANSLIFPDYMDILQCISNCNETHNLGLSRRKQGQIAKKAFIELGEHLQRVRQQDYWDTFSLFLEKREEDPAIKNPELAEKLKKNRQDGEQKMKELFEEYVKKQENFDEVEAVEEENDNDDEEEEEGSPEDVIEVTEEIDETESDLKIDKKTEEVKNIPRESKDGAILEISSSAKQNVDEIPVKNGDKEVIKDVDNKDIKVIQDKSPNTTKNIVAVIEDKEAKDVIDIIELEKSDSKELKINSLDVKKPVVAAEVQLSHGVGETKKWQPLIKVRSFATSPSTWTDGTDKSMVLQELSVVESCGEGHKLADNTVNKPNHKRGTENSVNNLYSAKVLPSSSTGKKKTDNIPTPKNVRKNFVRVRSIQPLNDKKAYITELQREHKKIDTIRIAANNTSVKPNMTPKAIRVCPRIDGMNVPQDLNPAHPL